MAFANLTWSNGADTLVAFDTGPANAPLNDFVKQSGYADYDVDGRLAAAGTVDEQQLAALLEHRFLSAPYPKSLDRFDFSWRMAEGYDLEAGAALLTAFSAAAVGCALDLLPQRPEKLIVCGGGRHNPTLMRELCKRTAATVVPAEAVGWARRRHGGGVFCLSGHAQVEVVAVKFPRHHGCLIACMCR